jgi:hypothetical protein
MIGKMCALLLFMLLWVSVVAESFLSLISRLVLMWQLAWVCY